jgi:preprotein translocase subunit SecG
MPSSSNDAWLVWVLIVLFLVVCFGLIIWIYLDSQKSGGIKMNDSATIVYT